MWNIADLLEAIAARIPDEPAIIDRGRIVTWADFEPTGEALAADLVERGVSEGARVGVALHNSAEHLIAYFACFKARGVPFNINYRYNAKEVRYLVDDASAEALIIDDDYVATVFEAAQDPAACSIASTRAHSPSASFRSARRVRQPTAGSHDRAGTGSPTTRCFCTPAERRECPRRSCGSNRRWSSCWPGR